jgi:hypothetical protein
MNKRTFRSLNLGISLRSKTAFQVLLLRDSSLDQQHQQLRKDGNAVQNSASEQHPSWFVGTGQHERPWVGEQTLHGTPSLMWIYVQILSQELQELWADASHPVQAIFSLAGHWNHWSNFWKNVVMQNFPREIAIQLAPGKELWYLYSLWVDRVDTADKCWVQEEKRDRPE